MSPFCQWDVEMGWIIFCAAGKVSKYGNFSGPSFPVFGLNTEIYGVNLRIQSEYRKMQTRKNSVFGHLSRSADLKKTIKGFQKFAQTGGSYI